MNGSIQGPSVHSLVISDVLGGVVSAGIVVPINTAIAAAAAAAVTVVEELALVAFSVLLL